MCATPPTVLCRFFRNLTDVFVMVIVMWFGYYPEIIFCHFFHNLNLVIFRRFYYQSEKIVGTLCAQLLLQFYIDSFETSQVFCTWSEDMHVVLI